MVQAACRYTSMLLALLDRLLKICTKSAVRFVCAVVLVALVTADLATFIYGYHYDLMEDDDSWPSFQLLLGGGLLFSILLIPFIAYFFSVSTKKLSQYWLGVHITWGDDWAHHTVALLYELQVKPVLDTLQDILNLDIIPKDLKKAAFWWWFIQGLLMVVLVRVLENHDAEDDDFHEDESEECESHMASCSRPSLETEDRLALVAPSVTYPSEQLAIQVTQDSTTIEEISSTLGGITP